MIAGLSLQQALENLRKVKKDFHTLVKTSDEIWDQALQEWAEAWEKRGKGEKATQLRNLKNIERRSCSFSKLGKIFRDRHRGSLASVLIEKEKDDPEEPDEWIRVTDSDEVQRLIKS